MAMSNAPAVCAFHNVWFEEEFILIRRLRRRPVGTPCREQAYPHTTVESLGGMGGFIADCEAAPGAITVGRTEHEAFAEMRSALSDWAGLMLRRGYPLPDIGSADPRTHR